MAESSNCYRGKIKKGRNIGHYKRNVILRKEVKKGFTENVIFEQRLWEVKQAKQRTGGRAVQTNGTACAKALRLDCIWSPRCPFG